MIYINVENAIKELTKAHRDLSPVEVKRAIAFSLNRTITGARTKSSSFVRSVYKIRSSDTKKTLTKRNANSLNLEAQLISTGAALPLVGFPNRNTKAGMRVTIKGQRKTFPGAFYATMRSGHKGIFARAKYQGNTLVSRRTRVRRTNENDLPITEVRSLAVPSALGNDIVTSNLNQLIKTRFPNTLANQLKFRSMRAAGLL